MEGKIITADWPRMLVGFGYLSCLTVHYFPLRNNMPTSLDTKIMWN